MTNAWNNIIKPTLVRHELHVGLTSYFEENFSIKKSPQYDINTRFFLSPFLTGTSFDKAAWVLVSLNIEGTLGTKRTFYNHQALLTGDIIKITKAVIKEAQDKEIKATILEIMNKRVWKRSYK